MFIFAISVQKIDFEQSQLKKVGVAIAEFHLFQLLLLQTSYFKGLQVLLDDYFYHRNANFVQKVNFERSQFEKMGVALTVFS